ncbi:hypothetical protein ACNKU7_08910 [Microbulbifer sp. SA54]|uniref:hypothetical protein n=1 Tax=Microbulbifer sp. SA54 TaxID=3401577 RepID=UPI003AAA5968
MEINPYSAPTADLNVAATTSDDLISDNFRRFSAWWVFLLSIVTLRIYTVYWIIINARTLNRIQSNPIAPIWLLLMVIFLASSYVLEYAFPQMEWAIAATNIAYLVTLLTSLFKVKNRLQDLMTESTSSPSNLSSVLTFLFDAIYLQYKINEHIDHNRPTVDK